MRRIFAYLLLLLGLASAILWAQRDPGYVLLRYHHWNIETTLWFAVLLLVIFLFLLYVLMWVLSIPRVWRRWRYHRQLKHSNNAAVRGLSALIQGEWSLAERCFLNMIHGRKDNSCFPYLGAALAADAQSQPKRYQRYIAAAKTRLRIQDRDAITIDCVQAWVEWKHRSELSVALLIRLERLHQQCPHHPYVLTALQKIYEQQECWEKLIALLPALQKASVMSREAFADFEIMVYTRAWKLQIAEPVEYARVERYWHQHPKAVRRHPEMLGLYVDALTALGYTQRAYHCIERHLKTDWAPNLVRAYGAVAASISPAALDAAQKRCLVRAHKLACLWCKKHPQDADLLLTLGRLCIALERWDEARHYLQQSVQRCPRADTYGVLASVLVRFGGNGISEALECYRKALACG